MGEKGRIAKAAGLMSVATMISRVLGFVRDMVLAFYMGATGLSDTFFVAFRIPNLLRELFAEGSMSAAVIPVLTEYRKKGIDEASALVRVALGFVLVVVGSVCVVGIVFAPQVVAVIAPGFLDEPAKFSETVLYTRIMFPFLLFISLAALVMGALNTARRFFISALAPAMLNVSIISCVFAVSLTYGRPITGAAIGVALGGFVQFAFQGPAFLREGYSLLPKVDFRHPGLRQILLLVVPVILGMAVAQINIVVSNILASYLPEGSVTYLFYSMRLIQFPIGVFGVAMGMAVLPSLSSHALKRDFDALKDDFSFALRLLLFICIPSMVGLMSLRVPIVSTLFQRGQFDAAATTGTAEALLFYSIGIWAIVGVRVVAASFYSMKDTRSPVKAAVTALVANVLLSLALMGPMKHSGLALANALSSTINFSILFFLLYRKLGGLDTGGIRASVLKTLAASAFMGAAGVFFTGNPIWAQSGMGWQKAMHLGGAIMILGGVFIIISFILKSGELGFVADMVKRKFSKGEGQ